MSELLNAKILKNETLPKAKQDVPFLARVAMIRVDCSLDDWKHLVNLKKMTKIEDCRENCVSIWGRVRKHY